MTKRDTRSIDPELMNLRGELAPVAPFVDLATFAPPALEAPRPYASAGSIPPVAFDAAEVSVALPAPAPATSGTWRSALIGAAAALAFLGVASALPSAPAPKADLARAAQEALVAAPAAQGVTAPSSALAADEAARLDEPMIVLPTQLIVGSLPREGAHAAAAPAPKGREQSAGEKMAGALAAAPSLGDFEQADARAPLAALPEELDRAAAAAAIAAAGRAAARCLDEGDGTSSMPVRVTFAPSGRVTTATIEGGPFVGTAKGGCIAAALRSASVHAFQGAATAVSTSVRVR